MSTTSIRSDETAVTVTTEAGASWTETYRTRGMGGYFNMLDRVAARIDGTERPAITEAGTVSTFVTASGATFTTGPLFTDADRVA